MYSAPKDSAGQPEVIPINRATPRADGEQSANAGAPESAPMLAQNSAGGSNVPPPVVQSDLHWNAPQDWEPQPLNQFRRGSWQISGEEGAIDVSIIALSGDAGGLAANINRWRQQLDLGAWEEADFTENARMFDMAGNRAIFVAFSGPGSGQMSMGRPAAPPTVDGKLNRTVAAILPYGQETWFFKMTGPESMVEEREEEFLNFLTGVHSADAHGEHDHADAQGGQSLAQPETPPAAPQPPAPQAQGQGQGQMTGSVANAVSGQGLQYQVPEGWEEVEPGPVRAASFNVAGEAGETADVSVVALGGQSGSLLANINRWRGQVGLDTVESPEAANLEDIPVGNKAAKYLSLNNQGQAMEVAIVDHGDATWFFKMAGPTTVVADNQEKFREFLAGLTLP